MLNVINFGMKLSDAVSTRRIHHQLLPDRFEFEAGFPKQLQRALSQVHNMTLAQHIDYSSVQAIHVTKDGVIHAVSDPRTGGKPCGY